MSERKSASDSRTVVVGGGLIGICSAISLASRGERVVLIERESGLAQGASFANGAMLTPSMPDPWNAPGVWRELSRSFFDPDSPLLLRYGTLPSLMRWGLAFLYYSAPDWHSKATEANFMLAKFSAELTSKWCDEYCLDFDYSDTGTMKVFFDQASMDRSIETAMSLKNHGLTANVLNPEQTVTVESSLANVKDRICGSIVYPDDRIGDAQRFVQEIRNRCQDIGTEFLTGTNVKKISVKNGRLEGVVTETSLVKAGRVVLATGCESPKLLHDLGIRIPVKPVKGYSTTFERPLGSGPTRGVVDDAMHAAIVPIGDRLRLVGTAEFAGFDTTVRPARISNLFRLCENLYPDLLERLNDTPRTDWAGLRPVCADGRPLIGATHVPGLYVNTGHGHLGWTMAAGSGHLLASIILNERHELDARQFSVDRFS